MKRELEITPEPSGEERAAIAAALQAVLDQDGAPRSGRSWDAGIRADLDDDNGDVAGVGSAAPEAVLQATARRPRRRFGATRA